ncbi:MAG TPA: peptidoglycan DD-metalloendopeptidase family protein [Candidatus Tectomicrobia bacterium]|jgi:murein hydrolase activator|nr:peptidoglycan DD-metalloendopeptidase family protein [Candidatus Tectomicrobia bacterium]
MSMTSHRRRVQPQRPWGLPVSGAGRRLALGLLLGVTCWLVLGTVQGLGAPADLNQRLKEERQELKELKGQIQDYKNQLERTKRHERTVVQDLEESQRLLQQKRRELQAHERNLKLQAEKHAALVKEVEGLTAQLRAREGLLHTRLRALYKQGRVAYLPFLLSASDINDFFRRVRFTAKLVEYDADLVQQHRSNIEALERTRRSVKARAEQLQKARVQIAAKQQEIEQEQSKKNALLAKIRDEQGTYESAKKELEESSKHLMALINKLEKERKQALAREARERRQREQRQRQQRQQQARATPTPGPSAPFVEPFDGNGKFAKLRGQLTWPISGRLVSTYGKIKHPTFNTYTFNKGIGIGAAPGSEFRVIEAGQVLYANAFKGYGNLLIVDHGDSYYSLYAQASELLVQVGDRVKRNQVVGRTGEGGALNGPALYFEIRHQGKPENPLEWLANHRP